MNQNKKETINKRGKNRELYFTKIEDIRMLIKLLLEKEPKLKNLKWHDPFAADGRWSKVAKEFGIDCASSDIKPLNRKVRKLDAFDIIPQPDTLYIGNPPFSLSKKLVQHFKYKCAFIMQSSCFSLGVKRLWFFNRRKNIYSRSELKFDTDCGEVRVFCFFVYFNKNRKNSVIPKYVHLIPEPKLRANAFHGVPFKNNYHYVYH